jgi:hypothetical protein
MTKVGFSRTVTAGSKKRQQRFTRACLNRVEFAVSRTVTAQHGNMRSRHFPHRNRLSRTVTAQQSAMASRHFPHRNRARQYAKSALAAP